MSGAVHLIIGPEQHGVVRHARDVAHACADTVVRASLPDEVGDLPPCDVVHVAFTDRLFGRDVDAARAGFDRVADIVGRRGAELSVTLHDVPPVEHGGDELQRSRGELYQHVMERARGVVVNSGVELGLVEEFATSVHSVRMIMLPVHTVATPATGRSPLRPRSIVVLGFVYPDRGYDDVLAALPADGILTALGRASDGHEELERSYAGRAGAQWQLTGYVSDDRIGDYLADAAVPVAPNRRVTASGSINTWLAHGRRPLVADGPYARELAEARPGALWLYDAHDPDALAGAIARALADPRLTRLPVGVHRGPSMDDVAAAYCEHLHACVPPRALRRGDRVGVPDNRWDLIDATEPERRVSVVVPYFEAQRQLDLVLAALAMQTYPLHLLDIVVVDDGSAVAPVVDAAGSLAVQVLRQPDEGFRAARARNLGARAADGDVLVFCDGDTVPEPDFVAQLVRLPAACPDVVAVGRRRHADLSSMPTVGLAGWWAGRQMPPVLPEPAWLAEHYRSHADLLHSDRRSYRFMISAVLAVDARRFAALDGFDERFVGYGGEDWEFAHRARTAGAVLAHEPSAVAWHDGPDWAGREDAAARVVEKAGEAARLAELLPDPDARGWDGRWRYPSVVVDAPHLTLDEARAVVDCAPGIDCGIWLRGLDSGSDSAGDALAALRSVAAEPMSVHVGSPPADVTARAWCQVTLHAPASLADLRRLALLAERHGCVDTPAMTLWATRARARAARWAADPTAAHGPASATWLAQRWFGIQQRSTPRPWRAAGAGSAQPE